MRTVRTLQLEWQQRLRGAYPLQGYPLDDQGSLTLARPHSIEPRTYEVIRITDPQNQTAVARFSAEILQKLLLSAVTESFLGMRPDEVYLFAEGTKRRLTMEKRVIYLDASMDVGGSRVAAVYSDISGQNFALVYGTFAGTGLWNMELEAAANSVVLLQEGRRMATAYENGLILLFDANMREWWRFDTEEPVTLLACATEGEELAYGTQTGWIGMLDAEGARRWQTKVAGPVHALAMAKEGQLTVALCGSEENPRAPTTLICLDQAGQPVWEYEGDVPFTGLACSPSGEYIATSAQGSRFSLYRVVSTTVEALSVSRKDWRAYLPLVPEKGAMKTALQRLYAYLEECPDDVECWQQFEELKAQWMADVQWELAHLQADGEWEAALTLLQEALALAPYDVALFQQYVKLRQRFAEALLQQAKSLLQEGQADTVEPLLRKAIHLMPDLFEARQRLQEFRAGRAQEADKEAKERLERGELQEALACYEHAQAFAPTAERAQTMAALQVQIDFELGKQAYDRSRYAEAIFQFRKVLQREPNHAEAKRYLEFAQRFEQDTLSDVVSDRFRNLEE